MRALNISFFQWTHEFVGRVILIDDLSVFFASILIWILIAGFIVLIALQDGPRRKIYLFCEGALAVVLSRGIVTTAIQFFYHAQRPFNAYGFAPLISASGFSFPSGHTTFLFALATVAWYANKKWGIWYFTLSFIVGIARIYTGVHWPSDILGGMIIGIACGIIVHYLLRSSRKEIKSIPEHPSINA